MGRVRASLILVAAVLAATLALAATASARGAAADPGRWLLTGASQMPDNYWQGLASDPSDSQLFFIGPSQGLWQTTPDLVQTAGVDKVIPTALKKSVGYNHIGDPTWLDGEGGRVVLPMECYNPAQDPSNTCGKGAFGIADPQTLAFRYYVQLDPKFIPKAMWAETSPNGKLIWTSSGDDLIAYRASQVTQANAGPSGPELKPVKTLTGAVPPTGVTGAVFRHNQLLIAGESNHDYDVWAVNTKTGARKLKLEQHFCGESEGLDLFSGLGGRLHWIIAPSDDSGCTLSFGPTSALLHFKRSPGRQRYHVKVVDQSAGLGSVHVSLKVTRDGGRPVKEARVRFAGFPSTARTDSRGLAEVAADIPVPGWFEAVAVKGKRYGLSRTVTVGDPGAPAPASQPRRG